MVSVDTVVDGRAGAPGRDQLRAARGAARRHTTEELLERARTRPTRTRAVWRPVTVRGRRGRWARHDARTPSGPGVFAGTVPGGRIWWGGAA